MRHTLRTTALVATLMLAGVAQAEKTNGPVAPVAMDKGLRSATLPPPIGAAPAAPAATPPGTSGTQMTIKTKNFHPHANPAPQNRENGACDFPYVWSTMTKSCVLNTRAVTKMNDVTK